MVSIRSDVELVFAVKHGDPSAFTELVTRHYSSLRKLCLRFSREPGAADLVAAEAIGNAYKKIQSFEGRASFKGWLFQIAMELGYERFTNDHNSRELSGEPGADFSKQMIVELERLTWTERTSLVLRLFEGFGFQEIGKILECTPEFAKVQYRQAFLKMKDRLIVFIRTQDNASEQYYAADWWIEFLEGEIDPAFAKDMAILAQNSPADRGTLEELRDLRSRLIAADQFAYF